MKKDLRGKLDRAWQDQVSAVKEWKAKTGGKAIGLPLTDAPEELVWAAGALPVTIFGRDVPIQHADKHLQGFACGYSRSLTEQIERGDLDYLDGLIMPYACDTTRCLDLIYRHMKCFGFYDCIRLPKRITSEGVRTYYTAELKRVAEALAAFTGKKIDDAALSAAIKAYNSVRSGLLKLRSALAEGRDGVTTADYLSAVRAAMSLAPDVSAPLLTEAAADLGSPATSKKPRVVLAGKMAEPHELADLLEAAGLTAMQLRDKIARALSEFLPNPEVAVSVTEVRSLRVSVLGEVQRPGVLELRGTTTILEAIAMAGGFRDFASPSKIMVIRTDAHGRTEKIRFNYNRAVGGDEQNLVLKPGDVIVVP